MNYWFYRFNIIDWRVMDIVLVFIDSQLWHKKLKQQNLLSLSGDKKINQTDTNTRDLYKKDCKGQYTQIGFTGVAFRFSVFFQAAIVYVVD